MITDEDFKKNDEDGGYYPVNGSRLVYEVEFLNGAHIFDKKNPLDVKNVQQAFSAEICKCLDELLKMSPYFRHNGTAFGPGFWSRWTSFVDQVKQTNTIADWLNQASIQNDPLTIQRKKLQELRDKANASTE